MANAPYAVMLSFPRSNCEPFAVWFHESELREADNDKLD